MGRQLIIIFFLTLFFPSVYAQSDLSYGQKSSRIKHYTSREGLSNNYIYCITRDEKGFMWFGTLKGLNRFDGYDFKIYTHDPQNDNSISNNTVTAISEYAPGLLLIGTLNGLNILDLVHNRFYRYYSDSSRTDGLPGDHIYTIAPASEGKVWLGTDKGLCLFSAQWEAQQLVVKFEQDELVQKLNQSLQSERVVECLQDSANNLWIGTSASGVIKADYQTQRLETFHFKNFIGAPSDNIDALAQYKGKIWVASSVGAQTIDMQSGEIKAYFLNEGLTNTPIKDIIRDSNGKLWLASYEGLFLYQDATHTFTLMQANPQDPFSLNNNFIRCLYAEPNILWIGTERGGINALDQNIKNFYSITPQSNTDNALSYNEINSLWLDGETLWIGTAGGGLDLYDVQSKTYTHYRHQPQKPASISGNYISALFFDHEDRLWVGTWGFGMNRVQDPQNRPLQFEHPLPEMLYIASFMEDKYQRLWISTADGLLLKEPNSDKFHLLKMPHIADGKIWYLGDLSTDSFGNIFVPTQENGLFVLKCKEDFQEQLHLKPEDVLRFTNAKNDKRTIPPSLLTCYTDSDQTTWIGSRSSGLVKIIQDADDIFNAENIEFQSIDERQGLCNDIVLRILEDDHKNLWLSTPNGLARYNTRSEEITNYYEEDGLSRNEFFWYAGIKAPNGYMYFGTTNGITYFNPEDILENKEIPQILLSDFKVINESSLALNTSHKMQRKKISTDIAYARNLFLNYQQQIFSFTFSSTSYTNPVKNQFAYMLDGFNHDWIYVDSDNRMAQYSNIPGGHYTLRIKAANNDGYWNEEGLSLPIYIKPPFTKTWLFRIIIILTLTLLVFTLYRMRLSALKSQALALEHKVKERTQQLSSANEKLHDKNEEINAQKEELEQQNEKLEKAYQELALYRSDLERLVVERTQELQVAKEKAEESDRLKSSFLANMSHEIRTPLNAILGFSTLLASEDLPQEEKENLEQIILSSGNDLLQLVSNIIDLSIIESQQIKLKIKKLQIDAICEEVFQEFKDSIALSTKPDLKFILQKDEQLADHYTFESDPVRLKQILLNFLTNAYKFTESGKVILGYQLLPQDKKVRFYVKDTGIGISKENLEKVFQRFHKVEDDSQALFRGAGLGLALCAGLIQLLGGEKQAESVPFRGSTFSFALPLT